MLSSETSKGGPKESAHSLKAKKSQKKSLKKSLETKKDKIEVQNQSKKPWYVKRNVLSSETSKGGPKESAHSLKANK